MAERYIPVDLSQLPEIELTEDTATFVQGEDENGDPKSGKTFISKIIAFVYQVAALLQIERKFTFRIENELYPDFFIGEETTIYGVEVLNVSSLTINVEPTHENSAGNWEPSGGTDFDIDLTPGKKLNIIVPARSVVTIKAEPISADTKKWYVWLNAKAKQL